MDVKSTGRNQKSNRTSGRVLTPPPKNPNKRPTKINANRTLGIMKAEDRALIRKVY